MDRNELKNLLMNKNIPTYVYNLDEVNGDVINDGLYERNA